MLISLFQKLKYFHVYSLFLFYFTLFYLFYFDLNISVFIISYSKKLPKELDDKVEKLISYLEVSTETLVKSDKKDLALRLKFLISQDQQVLNSLKPRYINIDKGGGDENEANQNEDDDSMIVENSMEIEEDFKFINEYVLVYKFQIDQKKSSSNYSSNLLYKINELDDLDIDLLKLAYDLGLYVFFGELHLVQDIKGFKYKDKREYGEKYCCLNNIIEALTINQKDKLKSKPANEIKNDINKWSQLKILENSFKITPQSLLEEINNQKKQQAKEDEEEFREEEEQVHEILERFNEVGYDGSNVQDQYYERSEGNGINGKKESRNNNNSSKNNSLGKRIFKSKNVLVFIPKCRFKEIIQGNCSNEYEKVKMLIKLFIKQNLNSSTDKKEFADLLVTMGLLYPDQPSKSLIKYNSSGSKIVDLNFIKLPAVVEELAKNFAPNNLGYIRDQFKLRVFSNPCEFYTALSHILPLLNETHHKQIIKKTIQLLKPSKLDERYNTKDQSFVVKVLTITKDYILQFIKYQSIFPNLLDLQDVTQFIQVFSEFNEYLKEMDLDLQKKIFSQSFSLKIDQFLKNNKLNNKLINIKDSVNNSNDNSNSSNSNSSNRENLKRNNQDKDQEQQSKKQKLDTVNKENDNSKTNNETRTKNKPPVSDSSISYENNSDSDSDREKRKVNRIVSHIDNTKPVLEKRQFDDSKIQSQQNKKEESLLSQNESKEKDKEIQQLQKQHPASQPQKSQQPLSPSQKQQAPSQPQKSQHPDIASDTIDNNSINNNNNSNNNNNDNDDGINKNHSTKLYSYSKVKSIISSFSKYEKIVTDEDFKNKNQVKINLKKALDIASSYQWEYKQKIDPRIFNLSHYFASVPKNDIFQEEFLKRYYTNITSPISILMILNKLKNQEDYLLDGFLFDINTMENNTLLNCGNRSDIVWTFYTFKYFLYKSLYQDSMIPEQDFNSCQDHYFNKTKSIEESLKHLSPKLILNNDNTKK